ncbi:hypothetical protein NQ318_004870 [Aromia moschata]|uniref:Uncharacterized protein n=1 Tax=Aromia moschata TaxID=1265417 RepID=A0AAV8Z093_9CUCU|nr:hypothetical protein NQ318_004870 [Aromia moschata]
MYLTHSQCRSCQHLHSLDAMKMDFRRKLKLSKPSSEDNLAEILVEVERKLDDMQPVIQDTNLEKSKLQKTMTEIRSYVDCLKTFGGTVTEDQRERIKDVTKRYKDMSDKYSHPDQVSTMVPGSPKPLRKKFSPDVGKEVPRAPQNKVVLLEVEEKLKSMRQRRLDRLSVFVAEQSKLSEERSKSNDASEIEDAIKSIQKTEAEKKIVITSIAEEIPSQNKVIREIHTEVDIKNSPKLGRTRSNESDKFKNSKNSTLRFINKFNCTYPSGSSTEDLTKEVYNLVEARPQVVEDRSEKQANLVKSDVEKATLEKHNVLKEIQSNTEDSGYNPLLSPVGKQRKAVYLYEHECEFLEKEKRSSLPALTTFGKEVSQEMPAKQSSDVKNPESQNKEESDKKSGDETISKRTSIELEKVSGVSESVEKENNELMDGANKESNNKTSATEDKKGSDRNGTNKKVNVKSTEEKNITGDSIKTSINEIKVNNPKKHITESSGIKSLPRRDIQIDIRSCKKLDRNVHVPKSPLPVPRKCSHAERVLKKLQRNWESLNEILDNDSDVDCEEIEDLKKTWEEANGILKDYETRIKKLERNSKEEVDLEKLSHIKLQLEGMEEHIGKFKGLKRDSAYKQLSSRLSNYFLEVSKMKYTSDDAINEKKIIIKLIEEHIKMLEKRVAKNEDFLMEVFDDQAISDKMGCVLCKNDVSGTEVVIIISDANGTVIKDFRKKGKSIKKIVFVLPVIVVTNEDNEETVVYKPDENAEPKVEKILVNS